MIENSTKFERNTEIKNDLPERFIIFVAARMRPIVSFSNFERAERLAMIFARLANVRMEVFDSEKEICYFIDSFDGMSPSVH